MASSKVSRPSSFKRLGQIISDLKSLEQIEMKEEGSELESIEVLKRNVRRNLKKLEKIPKERIQKQLERKKRRRRLTKRRAKLRKREEKVIESMNDKSEFPISLLNQPVQTISASTLKFEREKYKDAQKYLKTFDLLKTLFFVRSQDQDASVEFSSKFSHLTSKWESILQENNPQRFTHHKIEDQWNEAIFGSKQSSHDSKDQNTSNFLRIRRTWDSYITKSKIYGSSIPLGWVLPKPDADERWQAYKI